MLNVKLAILSNGTPGMLQSACVSTGINNYFDFIVSVDEVGIFKPDKRVYELVNSKMGYQTSEVLFVSSNGWDIVGATKYGFSPLGSIEVKSQLNVCLGSQIINFPTSHNSLIYLNSFVT